VRPAEIRYETVTTEAALDAWMRKIADAPIVAVDTETTSLDPMLAQLVGISLSVEPGEAAYIPWRIAAPTSRARAMARASTCSSAARVARGSDAPKLGQHLKYDAHVFANHGIALRGIAHDTMLELRAGFAPQSRHGQPGRAPAEPEDDHVRGSLRQGREQIGFDQIDLPRATEYAAEDADITLRLHRKMLPQLEAGRAEVRLRKIEMPVSVVLQKIERNGVLIDADRLAAQSAELGPHDGTRARRARAAGQPFNLGSPKQIGEILFNQLKLPVVKKTASGAPSTDEEVLQKLAEDYPLPKLLLDYRGLSKLKSTYTDKLPKMVNPPPARAHELRQATAVTGRLASTDPNLQNIPVRTEEGRRIREAFIAAPGNVIVSADYSQIELRIMAHISGDENLLRAFANGEDIHRATAGEIFGVEREAVNSEQRRYAKVINFGLIYGMSAFGWPATSASSARRPSTISTATSCATRRGALHGRDAPDGARAGLCRDRVRPPPVAAGHQRRQRPAPSGRRARGHQRADAGHRGRPDQAVDDRRAGLARRRAARHAPDHAGAR
jgi:DNA polymerase-1